MPSYLLLEDGDRRVLEDGGFRVLEDHTEIIIGSVQWASRGVDRLAGSRRMVRLANSRRLSR